MVEDGIPGLVCCVHHWRRGRTLSCVAVILHERLGNWARQLGGEEHALQRPRAAHGRVVSRAQRAEPGGLAKPTAPVFSSRPLASETTWPPLELAKASREPPSWKSRSVSLHCINSGRALLD